MGEDCRSIVHRVERRVPRRKKRNKTRDRQVRYDGDGGALLDKEVLERGADRGFAVRRLLLLLITGREPASHLAAAWLVR